MRKFIGRGLAAVAVAASVAACQPAIQSISTVGSHTTHAQKPASVIANPIGSVGKRSGLAWNSGVYPTGLADGNYLSRVKSFEQFRGRATDIVEGSEPSGSWQELLGGYAFSAYDGYQGTLAISVPMIPDGASMATGATGAYDAYWRQFGRMMIEKGRAKSLLRVGWEFSGDWYPWAAHNPAQWKAYFRHIVQSIKSTNPQAIVVWNGGIGDTHVGYNQFTQLYPGDDVVDMVGFDYYDMYVGRVKSDADWQRVLHLDGQGLDDWVAFAKAHNKKLAVPEWGLSGGEGGGYDNPFYVNKMFGWFRANASIIGFESYFNEQDSYIRNSLADPQQMPRAASTYRSAW
jgi:hypothetical protein